MAELLDTQLSVPGFAPTNGQQLTWRPDLRAAADKAVALLADFDPADWNNDSILGCNGTRCLDVKEWQLWLLVYRYLESVLTEWIMRMYEPASAMLHQRRRPRSTLSRLGSSSGGRPPAGQATPASLVRCCTARRSSLLANVPPH